jgi:hypothetical protein
MMEYMCPVWRSTTRSHFRKLQVLQSKCFCNATNKPWYIGNKQVHKNLGVPFPMDHIRSLGVLTHILSAVLCLGRMDSKG